MTAVAIVVIVVTGIVIDQLWKRTQAQRLAAAT
jgi:hypothetical protein